MQKATSSRARGHRLYWPGVLTGVAVVLIVAILIIYLTNGFFFALRGAPQQITQSAERYLRALTIEPGSIVTQGAPPGTVGLGKVLRNPEIYDQDGIEPIPPKGWHLLTFEDTPDAWMVSAHGMAERFSQELDPNDYWNGVVTQGQMTALSRAHRIFVDFTWDAPYGLYLIFYR